jgi:prevent-host-death family protein
MTGQKMKSISATEAKARFAALLSDVERGETVEITRHGKTIARITPEIDARKDEVRRAIDEMKQLRASLPKTGITVDDILEMRHEGHKY